MKSRRPHHPTLEELVADVRRQQALKGLVRQAEERWKTIPLKSKDSVNDGKSRENPQQYHQHSNVKEEINNIEEVKNLKPQR